MKKDISLSSLLNITSSDCHRIKIENLPLTVRQYNALKRTGCSTLGELLEMTLDDLYSIRNLGKSSIDGLLKSIKGYRGEDNSLMSKSHLPFYTIKPFRKYSKEIFEGDLESIQDDELDPSVLDRIKNAYSVTERDLIEKCAKEPQIVTPYADMLFSWSVFHDDVMSYFHTISRNRLRNRAIYYIEGFKDFNEEWDYVIPENFDKEVSLESFIKAIDISEWQSMKQFVAWCSLDIKEAAQMFINEVLQNEREYSIISFRKEGKTLEEVGVVYGLTRERIRQIEKKKKVIATNWVNKNKILRMMISDLNNQSYLSLTDFSNLLGSEGDTFFYLLSDDVGISLEGFIFNKEYNVYSHEERGNFEIAEDFVEGLPVLVKEEEYDALIADTIKQEGVPEDQFRLVFANEYTLGEGFYKKNNSRLQLSYVYERVLEQHFKDGIRVHMDEDIELFKDYVLKDYGIDISDKSNRSVDSLVSRIGIVCNRGTICPKRSDYIGQELKNKIRKYILEKKNPLILINSVFSVFEEELKIFGIDNRYYLQGVLKEEFSDCFYITRDYISREPVRSPIYASIVEYIKGFTRPVTKDEIFEEFPGLTEVVLNFSTTSDQGILNYFGEYIHIDSLRIYEFDKKYLNEKIEEIVKDNMPHHDEEIYQQMSIENPDMLNRLYITFPYRLFSFLEGFFGERYQFSRPFIATNEVEIGNSYERIREYVIGEECVEIEDVLGIAKELHYQVGSIIDFMKSFNETHILINVDQIATLHYVGLDNNDYEEIESCIINEITETIPIRKMTCIHQLKKLRVPWTEWLVYGLVDKLGKRLEVGVSNNQFRYAVPLIAPKGAINIAEYNGLKGEEGDTFRLADNLDDIDELIADLVAEEIEGEFK